MLLPKDFSSYTRKLMGEELFSQFVEGLDSPSPVSVRLNPFKSAGEVLNPSMNARPVEWCQHAYYLQKRPPFTMDPLLHSGAYYVQDASSMFIDQVLRNHVTQPVLMLDLCAAPGGKTTAAMSALPEGSVLVANEPMPLRAQILSENVQKYGHPDMVVTQNFPSDYLKTGMEFDVILADVPCSGEGMFRKDEGALREWSVQHVSDSSRLQREIIDAAWSMLRPGGLFIYSTCTFNSKENEENVAWLMEHHDAIPLEIETESKWGITGSLVADFNVPVYRFIPGISEGEGLFMAVMRKSGESASQSKKNSKADKRQKRQAKPSMPQYLSSWLKEEKDYSLRAIGDTIHAIPSRWEDYLEKMSSLKVIHAGVRLAKIKGKDHVPHHSLALSLALRRDAFPTCELNYTHAISYLRREAPILPPNTPSGYVLMTYKGHPLGFAKNLGTRSNNLYPQEWKIKSSHDTEEWSLLEPA